MKTKKIKKIILVAIICLSVCFLAIFTLTVYVIGKNVKQVCNRAQSEYKTSCVESLIEVLKCQCSCQSCKSFREKNQAIWALGQLGDKRALPILQSFYTGDIPKRESLDKAISQYELKKAIKLTSGGFNMTAIFWRYGF